MPKIGYGLDKITKFYLPNDLKKFVVRNKTDLNVFLMYKRTFYTDFTHNVSAKKWAKIMKRAQQISLKVINSREKVRVEEKNLKLVFLITK